MSYPSRCGFTLASLGFFAVSATAAMAADATIGEKEFKRCQACHAIIAPDGTKVHIGGIVGPNLYGVVGRPAGSLEGYRYSSALKKLHADGVVWTEENLAAYISDPDAFVAEESGDESLNTKMTFKTNEHQADIVAYLATAADAAGIETD